MRRGDNDPVSLPSSVLSIAETGAAGSPASRPHRRASGPGPAPAMVVTDMDGTLLDETGDKVSQRNIDALTRAGEAGARVVIATGRPIWWLGPVIEAGFTGNAVCMNGAVVY